MSYLEEKGDSKMAKQIHKKFTTEQVKELLQKYITKEIERKYLQEILGIRKSRFFKLLQDFKNNPKNFSVEYTRSSEAKRINPTIIKNLIKELAIDKKTINEFFTNTHHIDWQLCLSRTYF